MGNESRIRTEKYLLTLLPEESAMLTKMLMSMECQKQSICKGD